MTENNAKINSKYDIKITGNINIIHLTENEVIEKVPVKISEEEFYDVFYKKDNDSIFLGRYLKNFNVLDIDVKGDIILISLKKFFKEESALFPIKILTAFNKGDITLLNIKEGEIAKKFFGEDAIKYLIDSNNYLYNNSDFVRRKIK